MLEYSNNKDMKEVLKIIVAKINAMFNTDYNLISFDTLSIEDLLQTLCNVITYLGGYEKWDYKKPQQQQEVMMKVFQALSSINYVPYKENNLPMEPDRFREKLLAGDRAVVHQILYYLINNEQQCKKLLYLAKYIREIPIPPEVIDEQFANLKEEYDNARELFWSVYKENKKICLEAQVSDELREDIERMNKDIGNLSLRSEQQKEKLESVPQKAVYMEVAKQLRSETTHQKKLQEQLRDTQNTIDKLTDLRSSLESELHMRKMEHKNYANLILATRDEINVKKIMFADELPKQLQNALKDIQLYEIIYNEYIPHKEDLELLEIKLEESENEIRTLIERKNFLINNTEDKLGPFRNQAKVIANKKSEITSLVHELKENIGELDSSIEEKTRFMHELVGGTILHGTDLKSYVNSLRSQSTHYKMCRTKLQGINYELSILNRSLDILYLIGNNVEEEVRKNEYTQKKKVEVDSLDDINELKLKCRKVKENLDRLMATHVSNREEFVAFNKSVSVVEDAYKRNKVDFEEVTGLISDNITSLTNEFDRISNEVKEKEQKWKLLNTIIEKHENSITNLGKPTGLNELKETLNKHILSLKSDLENCNEQLAESQRIMKEDIVTVQSLTEAYNILLCKTQFK